MWHDMCSWSDSTEESMEIIPRDNILENFNGFRNYQFYGKTLIEGIQSAGETIYMPHYVNHAVYNLDETVAVGENPFYTTAIEEAAFQLYKSQYNFGFAHANGSRILVRKG